MPPTSSPLKLLKPGPFRRYMIGESVSMTGTWMQLMAQGWVMTTLTQSALMLGLMNAAQGIPQLVLSMKGGATADRHDKRTILLWCQLVQMGLAFLVGHLIASGTLALWHLMGVSVVLGVVHAFEMPAAAALVPELVPKEDISQAVALDRAVFHATRIVGPALAGAAIAQFGNASAFLLNGLSFLVLAIALATLPKALPVATEGEEAPGDGGIRAGFAYVQGDPPTMAMIGLIALTTVFVFPVMTVLMPLYSTQVLGLDAKGLSWLVSTSALGSLAGALALLRVERAWRPWVVRAGAAGCAVALVGLAAASSLAMASVAMVLMTVSISTMIGLANVIVQERVPGPMRGRVSAIAGLAFFGLMPFAGLGITSLADGVGIPYALLGSALCFALGAAFVLLGPGRQALALAAAPLPEEAQGDGLVEALAQEGPPRLDGPELRSEPEAGRG